MKKFLPFIIITILIAGIIGAAFIFSSKNSNVQPEFLGEEIGEETAGEPADQEEIEAEGNQGESIIGSLKQALGLGRSIECRWQRDENNYGVSKIKNDRVYTEVVADGQKTYSIFADDCNYAWSENQPQGVKICVNPEKAEEGEGEASEPEEFSWETPEISYSCREVTVDDSVFNPPAGIEFINPFEMMQGVNLPEGVEIPDGN